MGASSARGLSRRRAIRLGGSKGFASFARELSDDEVVGSAKKRSELGGSERVARFEGNPFRTGEIRRRDDAGTLGKLGEIFGCDFERQANGRGNERSDSEHLASDLEEEIVAPLNLFGGSGKGKTDFAELVDVHNLVKSICGLGWPANREQFYMEMALQGLVAMEMPSKSRLMG